MTYRATIKRDTRNPLSRDWHTTVEAKSEGAAYLKLANAGIDKSQVLTLEAL